MNNEILWIYDLSVLIDKNSILNIFPDIKNLSISENLNRLMRFFIYYLLILYIFDLVEVKTIMCGLLLWTIITIFIYTQNTDVVEKFTLDNNKKDIEVVERKSTSNNPVMNLSVLDYGKNIDIRVDLEDTNIDKNILGKEFDSISKYNYNELGRANLVRRNFYTMPNTKVPNEQTEFARCLYDKGPTCKEDTTKCYKNLPDLLQVGRRN